MRLMDWNCWIRGDNWTIDGLHCLDFEFPVNVLFRFLRVAFEEHSVLFFLIYGSGSILLNFLKTFHFREIRFDVSFELAK